ncbi:proliferating cell nuclear antigen [Lentinus tigrinus ALCF2SS1-7]|uniref:DNA sliding clamp PCNA n=1 Tax=Lentinus tigrinus ALCF2SS1-6 TaxID=1328759 RepID=A0A5C2RR10_9APHY|nr:proliferating cell nuclear antigen [Lentinus tigrinus ALCF2SS1-6]RPD68201.1 proliferating cell nuclear antigen [Lentinus tigrinus ALCF2SS1-7]
MLEAKLSEAALLKRLLDAVKELVSDANFECNEEGITLQAMDNSHVALVAVKLEASGFKRYRCDRSIPLGVNLGSLTKVLKCAKDDDILTLKAGDDADILSLTYEAKNSDRIAEYEMKLMDIDADTLGIPDTEYDASVTMPSAEFSRIVRDLSLLGESVRIEVSKEGIRFVSDGEAANGNILLKQSAEASKKGSSSKRKDDDDEEDEPEEEEGADSDDDGGKKKVKKEKVKKEKVKKEDNGEDVEMNGDDEEEGEGEFKPTKEDDDEQEDDDDEGSSKKRKRSSGKSSKPAKKAKKQDEDDEDDDFEGVRIEMNQAVTLTFSLKYLVNFSKSASLSKKVQLMMSNDVPLLVSYSFNQGHIRYYLAPKIGDD